MPASGDSVVHSGHSHASRPSIARHTTERLLSVSASGRFFTERKSRHFRLPKRFAGCTLGSGQYHTMDTLDYVLLIGGILVFIFTIVMDVLLVREWIEKRKGKQKPPDSTGT